MQVAQNSDFLHRNTLRDVFFTASMVPTRTCASLQHPSIIRGLMARRADPQGDPARTCTSLHPPSIIPVNMSMQVVQLCGLGHLLTTPLPSAYSPWRLILVFGPGECSASASGFNASWYYVFFTHMFKPCVFINGFKIIAIWIKHRFYMIFNDFHYVLYFLYFTLFFIASRVGPWSLSGRRAAHSIYIYIYIYMLCLLIYIHIN